MYNETILSCRYSVLRNFTKIITFGRQINVTLKIDITIKTTYNIVMKKPDVPSFSLQTHFLALILPPKHF